MDICSTGNVGKNQGVHSNWWTLNYSTGRSRPKHGTTNHIWLLSYPQSRGPGTIPLSQWGSCPNRSSTDAILLKRLSYDGLALLQQSAIIFNNDCKSAFDRMIPSVGGIALRRLGASTNVVSTLLQTLQQMKYQVRTSLGLSDQTFSNLNDWVLGFLQGSGASPCLWMAITCVLLGALQKQSPGITFSNPQGTAVCNRIGEAYVDIWFVLHPIATNDLWRWHEIFQLELPSNCNLSAIRYTVSC